MNLTNPTSHANDPATSREAAAAVDAKGTRQHHASIVLALVKAHPGCTAIELVTYQLANAKRLDEYQVRRRLTDLRAAGLVVQGEPRACRVRSSKMVVWYIAGKPAGVLFENSTGQLTRPRDTMRKKKTGSGATTLPAVDSPESLAPGGWGHGNFELRRKSLQLLPRRVRVLLACEWARSVLPLFVKWNPTDSRPRLAIESAEKWAAIPANAATTSAAANAAYAAYAANDAANAKWRWIAATYRHARGPVGLVFDLEWRTSTAVSMARGIREDRAFDRFPILADALQDAGCENLELILHLQTDAGEWTCADWSLWNLLGYGDSR